MKANLIFRGGRGGGGRVPGGVQVGSADHEKLKCNSGRTNFKKTYGPYTHFLSFIQEMIYIEIHFFFRLAESCSHATTRSGIRCPVVGVPDLFASGRIKNKSKMASADQQCAGNEGSTESPYYLQLSYFTIYLTKGIEILEYYTKVRC